MLLNLLKELEIEEVGKDLGTVTFAFSPPLGLEITTPDFLSAKSLGKLFYSLYNKLNYLFDYLDYHVKVAKEISEISKNTVHEYFSLVCSAPFLWKDKEDLIFFCEQKDLLESFIWKRNIVYLYFSDQSTLNSWKPKVIVFKETLGKLGLNNIRFALKQKDNSEDSNGNNEEDSKKKKLVLSHLKIFNYFQIAKVN